MDIFLTVMIRTRSSSESLSRLITLSEKSREAERLERWRTGMDSQPRNAFSCFESTTPLGDPVLLAEHGFDADTWRSWSVGGMGLYELCEHARSQRALTNHHLTLLSHLETVISGQQWLIHLNFDDGTTEFVQPCNSMAELSLAMGIQFGHRYCGGVLYSGCFS